MTKTAIITGASSGIGKLTALRFAEEGINVVLAARSYEKLDELALECQALGVKAVALKTDVTKKEDIERLAARTIQQFGSFDIWVNNASSIMYGRFLDVPLDDFKKLLDTNLLGYVYGAREALTQFIAQGHGSLINVASGYGAIPAPFASAYVTSKFVVKGFSASLRQELIADKIKNIHVSTILPATMDTPVYQSAANKMGKEVRPLPPIYNPQLVADAIFRVTLRPKAEVSVGSAMRVPVVLYSIMPGIFTGLFAKYVNTFGYRNDRNVSFTEGNLYEPSNNHDARGGWKQTSYARRLIVPALAVGGLIALSQHKKIQKAR